MSTRQSLPLNFRRQLYCGIYILLCIPAILIAERYDSYEAPFHLTQFIAIIICFVSGIIALVKERKMLNWVSLLISSIGVLLTGLFLLFVGSFLLGPTMSDYSHRRKFDAQIWKQSVNDRSQWPPRLCMVDNLVRSKKLKGLTESEVIALLGEPEEKGFPFGASSCDIHYYLGPERGFIRIDSEWLFITFGEDGKVDRCWLYTD